MSTSPDPAVLRRLSASCRRMVTAIQADKGSKKLRDERKRLLESMSAVLDELGCPTNAQLLLMVRDRDVESAEPDEPGSS